MTRVPRWRSMSLVTLGLFMIGALFAAPRLLALGVLPLAYVVYGALSGLPATARVGVTRSFEPRTPAPGEAVTVSLTVRNDGETVLPDLRVIDGVPDELTVLDGRPRGGLVLRPGETATITYTLKAKQGEYAFDHPVARLRSLAGSAVTTVELEAEGDDRLVCRTVVSDAPVREASIAQAGVLPTNTGGSGVEFHSTRAYHSGDPLRRIDWRHYAKTNALTTVDYHEERAGRVVVIVDVRPVARKVLAAGYPTGAELAGYAAERTHGLLTEAGHNVGVTAVGIDDDELALADGSAGLPWIPPDDDGTEGRTDLLFSAVQTCGQDRASSGSDPGHRAAPDGGRKDWTDALLARCPPEASILLFSPVLDAWPLTLSERLRGRGYPVTVISPDITGAGSPGRRVARIDRTRRLRHLEASGVRTVDWTPTEPLGLALKVALADLVG